MAIVFLDGHYVQEEEACVPFSNRGLLFGDGVFTTIKVSNGFVECLDLHLKRLKDNCKQINLAFPEIKQSRIRELIVQNNALESAWRLKIAITRGESAKLDLSDPTCGKLLMFLKPYRLPDKDVCLLTIFPEPICRPCARIKSLAYLDRLFVMDFALKKGFDDALVISPEGYLLEGAYSNLFWFYEGECFTPDHSLPLIPGITLSILKQIAIEASMPFQEVRCKAKEIPSGAHVFLCNSLTGFRPAISIEDREFPRDYSLESMLSTAYIELISKYSFSCHIKT